MTSARRLQISAELTDYIRSLHPEVKRKVRATFDSLLADPLSGKPLRGRLFGYWSISVGKFRVIYHYAGESVQIVAVGTRRTIYEETERLARKRPGD